MKTSVGDSEKAKKIPIPEGFHEMSTSTENLFATILNGGFQCGQEGIGIPQCRHYFFYIPTVSPLHAYQEADCDFLPLSLILNNIIAIGVKVLCLQIKEKFFTYCVP